MQYQLMDLKNYVDAIEDHLSAHQNHLDARVFIEIVLCVTLVILGWKPRKSDAYETLGALVALFFLFSRPRWLHKKW